MELAPNTANAHTAATPMAPPAVQAVAASGSSKGAPSFVAADPDLVAKEDAAQDSWLVVSHLMMQIRSSSAGVLSVESSLVRVIQNISLEP
jgi:hypothetical protein